MKTRDIIIAGTLAFVSTLLLQYFFSPQIPVDGSVRPGTEFIAPTSPTAALPLNLEVDFYDAAAKRDTQITTIETPLAHWEFSNDGAVVQSLSYKRLVSGKQALLTVITPVEQKDQGAFLIALNDLGSTPYYYDLVKSSKEGGITTLVYQAESEKAKVTKTFVVHDDSYRLELKVAVEPKKDAVQARLFFPAPVLMQEKFDVIQGIIFTDRNKVVKKAEKDLSGKGWDHPALFGAEDRYFAHVLVQDPAQFTNRAYFRTGNKLSAILEGPKVKEPTSWQLGFFAGPKESEALAAVDQRLEALLDYGWLAPISKPLLWLLKFFYGFLKNYGLAIIALTLLLKVILAPLAWQGERSMKKGTELQKKMQHVEQKYRHDPETLAREKAELMKKHGMSMLGCLPLFLQIPIFLGLNRVLSTAIELYKAPFLWISDLSSKDPYYILPLLIGLGMFLTQTSVKGDAKQRLSSAVLSVVIMGASSLLSAGLALFISVSTLLSVAQTKIQKALRI